MAAATGYGNAPTDEPLLAYAELPKHGRYLAEVFAVRVPAAAGGNRPPPCGTISFHGGHCCSDFIYSWNPAEEPSSVQPCDSQTRAPGRPKKTRIRSSAEGTGLGPRKRICKRCGELGHFASKCKNAVDPSFGEDQHWGAENAVEPEKAVEPSRKKNAPKRRKKKKGEDTIAIVPLAEPSTLVSQQRKKKMGKEVVRTTEDGKSRRPIRSKKIWQILDL